MATVLLKCDVKSQDYKKSKTARVTCTSIENHLKQACQTQNTVLDAKGVLKAKKLSAGKEFEINLHFLKNGLRL